MTTRPATQKLKDHSTELRDELLSKRPATALRKVLHKQLYKPGPWGSYINTTFCRRVRKGREMNVADYDHYVTCKFCLRLLAKAKEQP